MISSCIHFQPVRCKELRMSELHQLITEISWAESVASFSRSDISPRRLYRAIAANYVMGHHLMGESKVTVNRNWRDYNVINKIGDK